MVFIGLMKKYLRKNNKEFIKSLIANKDKAPEEKVAAQYQSIESESRA
jgi:hypothetical protein